MRTTLFVAGFGSRTRARDLAYEFERYGRLVRCDIPAPKSFSSKPYAFVEFEDFRDAEDAFNEMHARRIDGYTISVQWARNAPSSSWRFDRSPHQRRSPSPYYSSRHSYGRSRSRSPYHRGRSPPLYHRGPSPLRGRSPPPPHPPLYNHNNRLSHSRSPPPPIRHHDDYPVGISLPPPLPPSSNNDHRLSPKSSSSYYRGGGSSRSPSPSQRRSLSPTGSRSPES